MESASLTIIVPDIVSETVAQGSAKVLTIQIEVSFETADGDEVVKSYTITLRLIRGEEVFDPEQELAARFAPVLRMHPEENYFPVDVQAMLNRAELRNFPSGQLVNAELPPAELPEDTYLDLPEASPDDGNEEAIRLYGEAYAENEHIYPTVYAAVHKDTDGNRLALQYWFFYYANPWNNVHEGDWEMIQLEFAAADELIILGLGLQPERAVYSQHLSAKSFDWDAVNIEGHPVVYVAEGSHASYEIAQSTFQILGFDHTSDDGLALAPAGFTGELNRSQSYGEPVMIRPNAQGWLSFAGRWGEDVQLDIGQGRSGPRGPAFQPKWLDPFGWWCIFCP